MKKVIILLVILLTTMGGYYFYPETKMPTGVKINKLVVYKSKRKMMAYADGNLIKIYTISIGRNPIGDKEYEGDKKTPEGIYYIKSKNPKSGYYKNLGISYPNNADRKAAKKLGKSAGGDIKIHGQRNGLGFISKFHRWWDWTAGCIAVTNVEMEELYNSVAIGATIEIKP